MFVASMMIDGTAFIGTSVMPLLTFVVKKSARGSLPHIRAAVAVP